MTMTIDPSNYNTKYRTNLASKKMEDEEKEGLRTVECLRGRLLAERQVSRSAKDDAELLTKKMEELEGHLKEEIRLREKAEKRLKFLMKKLESIKRSRSLEGSEQLSSSEVSCLSSVSTSASKEEEAEETHENKEDKTDQATSMEEDSSSKLKDVSSCEASVVASTSSHEEESQAASDANEPSLSWLPRDIIWNCLLRVQRSDHLSVSRVSKSLNSLVCSPEFRCLFPKDSLYVSFVAPGMASNWLWFTLRRLPTKKNEYQLVHVPIPVPFPRHPWLSPPKTVVAGSEIYFIGGPYHLSNDTDLWIFDTRSGKLTQGPSMKVSRRRGGYLVGVIEGKIYVIGGEEVNEEVQVEVFDPKTRSWDFAGEEKECNPSSTFTVSMDQKVYMVGSTADVSAYNPNPSGGRRVELIRKVQNRNKTYEEFVDRMECVCEVENVMYACFDWCGLKWFDTKLKVWKKLVRRDGKPLYANHVSAMSEYNGMLAVMEAKKFWF